MKTLVTRIKKDVVVEADFIIAGVFFAARNGWELLRDARMLHNARSFASAYGLAVFCREELGKSKIWQEQWSRRRRGDRVTLDDLKLGGATNYRKKLERVGSTCLKEFSLVESHLSRALVKKRSWRRESTK